MTTNATWYLYLYDPLTKAVYEPQDERCLQRQRGQKQLARGSPASTSGVRMRSYRQCMKHREARCTMDGVCCNGMSFRSSVAVCKAKHVQCEYVIGVQDITIRVILAPRMSSR